MKLIINREELIKSLYQINSALSSRPILPILNNILLRVNEGVLQLITTDLEIEIIINILLNKRYEIGETTIPARKFYEIWKNLPEFSEIKLEINNNKLTIDSGRSHFLLSTLPSVNFPNINIWKSKIDFSISQTTLKNLIEATQFSMANQDIRYYLNGMLIETKNQIIRSVSTDGHRLSIYDANIEFTVPYNKIIIPRKGVIELLHLLNNNNSLVKIEIGENNIRAYLNNIIFTSKLIDGHFPDYHQVLPKNTNKILETNCDSLKQALLRTSILSNKINLGVRLYLSKNQLCITANNQEQEIAEETIDVMYHGIDIEICFNVKYILDILSVIKSKYVQFLLTDSISSVLIKNPEKQTAIYVIMPMRL
ncbi:DNA polymerase III subunit beta [Candidatus Providencia siddallii]|uniref:Beta sliding clamp n=1 Tax=Candidatus Providencia siddallii TaxID=1715285 RepID=A0A0M6W9M1_9GAMM|nr:DNA polymerase III subunit beta [Candidatus Providencia siddallii]